MKIGGESSASGPRLRSTLRLSHAKTAQSRQVALHFRRSLHVALRRTETMKIGGESSASGPRLRSILSSSHAKTAQPRQVALHFRRSLHVALRRTETMKIGGESSASGPRLRSILSSSHAKTAQPRQVALHFRRSKHMKGNIKPIPEGFHTVTPRMFVRGAAEAIEFYKRGFGATELDRHADPSGKIVNADIKIGDSIISLAE